MYGVQLEAIHQSGALISFGSIQLISNDNNNDDDDEVVKRVKRICHPLARSVDYSGRCCDFLLSRFCL